MKSITHRPSLSLIALFIAVAALFPGPGTVQAQTSFAKARAKEFLETNAAGILPLAHPTATYRGCATGEAFQIGHGGFAMILRLFIDDLSGNRTYSDILFHFDTQGRLLTIGRGATADGFPAFAVSGFLFELMKLSLLQDPEIDANTRAMIQQIPNMKSLVEYVLRIAQMAD